MKIDDKTKICAMVFAKRIAELPCNNQCGECPAHVVVSSYVGEGGICGDRLYEDYGCLKVAMKSFNKNIRKGTKNG